MRRGRATATTKRWKLWLLAFVFITALVIVGFVVAGNNTPKKAVVAEPPAANTKAPLPQAPEPTKAGADAPGVAADSSVATPVSRPAGVPCEGWACGLSDDLRSIAGCSATKLRSVAAEPVASAGHSLFRVRDRSTNESVHFESRVADPRLCHRAGTLHTTFLDKYRMYAPFKLGTPGSICEIGSAATIDQAKEKCDKEPACKGIYGPGAGNNTSFALTNARPGDCAVDWLPVKRSDTSDSCTRFFGKGFSTDSSGRCVPPSTDCPPGWETRAGACRPVCTSKEGTVDGNSQGWCRWAKGDAETTWGCPAGFEGTRTGTTEYCVPTKGAIDSSLFLSPLLAAPIEPKRTDAECDGWVCGISSKSLLACRALTPYSRDAVAKGIYNSVFRTDAGTFLSEAVDPRNCTEEAGQAAVTFKKKNVYPAATNRPPVFLQEDITTKATACEMSVYATEAQAARSCSTDETCAGYYYNKTTGPFTTASAEPRKCRVDWRPIKTPRSSCTRFFGPDFKDGARVTNTCIYTASDTSEGASCPLRWTRRCTNGICKCEPPCAKNVSDGVCQWDGSNACLPGFEYYTDSYWDSWRSGEMGQTRTDRLKSLGIEQSSTGFPNEINVCLGTKRAIDASKLLVPLVPSHT